MKKLLFIFCLVIFFASSLKAEEIQQQATWKAKTAKYSWIAMRVGYLGLCVYNFATPPPRVSKQHTQLHLLFILYTGGLTARSLYRDFRK